MRTGIPEMGIVKYCVIISCKRNKYTANEVKFTYAIHLILTVCFGQLFLFSRAPSNHFDSENTASRSR